MMSTGFKFAKFAGIAVLCLGFLGSANAASEHSQKKVKKPELPPLPSGPTGPVPQIPLDSMKPVPPQVSFQNGQLTIVAPNSTLGDILRAVRKQTGAEIEVPEAQERVVTHLGPGPAREVMAELLNGSRFNYVLLGSLEDASLLTRVVLVAKTGVDNVNPNNPQGPGQQPAMAQAGNMVRPQPPEMAQDTNDADTTDDTADDTAEQQATEPEPPAAAPDQPAVKTPQQMLQEMQQRQLQLQQQQQQQPPGQPPVPGQGVPPREQQ